MFLVLLYTRLRKHQLPKSKITIIIIVVIGSMEKEVEGGGWV